MPEHQKRKVAVTDQGANKHRVSMVGNDMRSFG